MLKLPSIPHFQQREKKKESCEAQEKEAERLGDDLAPWLFSFLFFSFWFALVWFLPSWGGGHYCGKALIQPNVFRA